MSQVRSGTNDEHKSLIYPELPWSTLPREISELLATALPQLVEEIIERIPQEVPEYARPIVGEFGTSVRRGVETALRRLFIALPGSDEPALTDETRAVYRRIGVGEAYMGRSLDVLLSAYWLSARVTFRAVSTLAARTGIEPWLMPPLGESIFIYIDEVSTASIEGFTEEQSRQLGERDRRRESLVRRMLVGNLQEVEARRLAGRAGWEIPSRVVAIVLPPEQAEGLRVALGDRALISSRTGEITVLIVAPTSQTARAKLVHALRGRRAWIGPERSWDLAAESQRVAALAAVTPTLVDGPDEPRWVVDHLTAIILQVDPELVKNLAVQRFSPMQDLRPAQQERLTETLLAWLRYRGERVRIAEELHVHPQTVGYRLSRLRDVFGYDLDDPDVRFELELVLRAGERPSVAT